MIENKHYINGNNKVCNVKIELAPMNRLNSQPRALKSVIDYVYTLVKAKKPILSNILRWETDTLGYSVDTSDLTGNPHVIRFANEILRGDSGFNNDGGFKFICGLPGVYRINSDIRIVVDSLDESIIDDYIDLLDEIKFGYYKNGTAENIQSGISFRAKKIGASNENRYLNADGKFIAYCHITGLFNLIENDIIDLRIGFLQYNPIAALLVNFSGWINIDYINNNGHSI